MTRQRRWQRRKIAEGRCQICGRQRGIYADYCDECGIKTRLQKRQSAGCNRWQEGHRGRPPYL